MLCPLVWIYYFQAQETFSCSKGKWNRYFSFNSFYVNRSFACTWFAPENILSVECTIGRGKSREGNIHEGIHVCGYGSVLKLTLDCPFCFSMFGSTVL